MRCAVDAVFQFRKRGGARGSIGRALHEFDLQLQRGERCAQLVRRVGGEAALRRQRVAQAQEQRVETAGQRSQFLRQAGLRQRLHRVGLAPLHGMRHRLERAQPASHRIPDEDAEKRNQRGQRQQRAQRRLRGDFAALVQRMRDLQCMPALDVRVHAPRMTIPEDVAVPLGRGHGQAGPGARVIDEHAVAVPDLGDDLGHARSAIRAGTGDARLTAPDQVVNSG